MARLPGNTDMDKLKALSGRVYSAQAKWVLNAYWAEWAEEQSEKVWDFAHKMVELDEKNGENGSELEELIAHRFLEEFQETLTVRELREILRKVDIDTNKRVSLAEYLIYRYKLDWHHLVNSIQGDKAQIDEAQRLLDAAQAALAEAQAKAQAARAAEAEALDAEKEFKVAQEEVEATLAELKRQEDEYKAKLDDCDRRSQTGGIVGRNKAKHEKEQLLREDPLPLARAKISSEAALRRAEKARAPFKAKREAAEAVRAEAEAALAVANDAFKKAEDYLDEVKRTSESKGSVWWIQRELEEAKKYLPQSKGGKPK